MKITYERTTADHKGRGRLVPSSRTDKTSVPLIGIILFLLAYILFAQEPTDRVVILPIEKVPKEAPLFFSASAEVDAKASLSEITTEQRLSFHIHQGKPETLTLALSGAGEVTSVTGGGLRDWSVRVTEDGSRFLDVRPNLPDGKSPADLEVVVKTLQNIEKNAASLLLPTPGVATGFSLALKITTDSGVDLRVVKADGLAPVRDADSHQFIGTAAAAVDVEISPSGSGSRGMELMDVTVVGKKSPDGGNVSFRLAGRARAKSEGSALELLAGGAALSGAVSGDGWHVALREKDGAFVYDLVAERSGEFPLALDIEVPVRRKGDWRTLNFNLPAGVVVPLWIEGLGEAVSFSRELAVVPERDGMNWRGFLPANGQAAMAWRAADAVTDGALFFSSTETSDVRVGSGLLRQITTVDLRVLQGKLSELSLTLNGPGEVLSVSGEPVLGWSVR